MLPSFIFSRYFAFGCSEFLVRSEASQIFGDDVVISEAHVDCTVFFGNELQKFHIGKIVVCYVTCDTTDVRRQEILLEENFKMLAQDANRAGHRSIEIDMQIADEKVVHALNLYSCIMVVKRIGCDKNTGRISANMGDYLFFTGTNRGTFLLRFFKFYSKQWHPSFLAVIRCPAHNLG